MAVLAIQFDNPAPPAPPATGVKLFLGSDGKFKALHPDGTAIEIGGGSATAYSATPPSSPADGDRWVDTTTLRAYEYVGGAWIEIVS